MILNRKVKYTILLLTTIFLIFSISYFIVHLFDIGFHQSNLKSIKMEGTEEFMLNVEKPTTICLSHNAEISSGKVFFKIIKENDEVIDEYSLNNDEFVSKVYDLNKGIYECSIKRNVSNNKEQFMLYYDKRYITLK